MVAAHPQRKAEVRRSPRLHVGSRRVRRLDAKGRSRACAGCCAGELWYSLPAHRDSNRSGDAVVVERVRTAFSRSGALSETLPRVRGCVQGEMTRVVHNEGRSPRIGYARAGVDRQYRLLRIRLGGRAVALGNRYAAARHTGQRPADGISRRTLGHHISDHSICDGIAALRDCSLSSRTQSGADADLAQHRHRDALDRCARSYSGDYRNTVLQADVLHGPGAQPGHDDQSHRAPVVLDVRISRPKRALF